MTKPDVMELEYWERWNKSRDKSAADALLQLYMPLVQYHVQRISAGLPKNVDRSELKSYGMIGLYDALEKFDRKRYLKFDTYASFRVRGAILDGLRKEDWMPRSVREKSKRIERASEQIEQEQKRAATLEEVAKKCRMSIEEVSQVVSEGLLTNLLSLDDGTSAGGSDYVQGAIEDQAATLPDQHLIEEEDRRALAREIDRLNEKERTVVSLFYYEGLTLTEIGQVLSLSTSRISQIHSKALFKLRQFLSEHRLSEH
ncbi:FliA/WhiG family RNA polymerase sigma factor [Sporolactobacillus vineae]|uniref:FliA/WhiG family RNA polymerase sigma factor n=1 Tax=Sporolactobacillus vineae TaxID=444463 RepID=UPI000289DE23|nr:FliA/WhiG family RNA polymerase sigma factor [Sporolactobacillus vineae]